MLPPTADEVTVFERGGVNPRRLLVAQSAVSWELSNAGMFSAFATMDAIQAAGLPRDLKGCWLEWESPAGRFGGVITGRPVTDGVAEIAAMSYAVLLRGRVVMFNMRPVMAPAGAIMRRVLQEEVRDHPLFLTIGTIDEGGPPMSMSFSAQDIFNDILPALATDSGHEWTVTPERVFHFGSTVGTDRSATVRLVEGRHIASYRVADDLWLTANSLIGVSASAEIETKEWMETIYEYQQVVSATYRKKKRKKKKPILVVDEPAVWDWVPVDHPMSYHSVDPFVSMGLSNVASIARYGLIEAIRTYGDTRDMGTIVGRLTKELATLVNPPVALELSLVNADECYRSFIEGDVVWIDIGSAALSGAFRVIHRTYDSGGLRIAGDLRPIGGS